MAEHDRLPASHWRSVVRRHARATGVDLPRETVDELAVHLDDLYAAARERGTDHHQAYERAVRALDESTLAPLTRRRDSRAAIARHADDTARAATTRHGSFAMLYALRMALRQFRQHPTFALVTVLVLGLGVGASAVVYTVVDAVVVQPLPYRAPDRLVTLWATNYQKGFSHEPLSPVNFMDYRSLPVFAGAAAWWRPDVNLVDPGLDPIKVTTIETSGNLFQVLGVDPQLGPGFPADGPLFADDLIAVISDRLWRARYGADPDIIGRQLQLNDTLYTVVGVMPARFNYPAGVDVWERLRWDMTHHSRDAHFMEAVARLSPNVDIERASQDVNALGARLADEFAASNKAWNVRLIPLLDDQLGYYQPALMVLFGAVGLLLVIGCLNVASLLFTRALSREREMAVRAALGASPRQLVSQLLAESLVLSVAGAVAGVLAAAVAIPVIVAATTVPIPRLADASLNGHVLGFGLAVIAGTTVFFGLVPALVLVRRRFVSAMRSGERGSSRGARRVYHGLVAGELALACALLVSSALLVRTVRHLMDVPTGVHADDTVLASVQLASTDAGNASATVEEQWTTVANVYGALVERIRRQPDVQAAGAGNFLPLEPGWRVPFTIQGQPAPPRPEDAPQAQHISVTDGYFEALGATLESGRLFSAHDTVDTAPVVVVNDAFVRHFLPGETAVGRLVTTVARGFGPLGVNLMIEERPLAGNRVGPAPRPSEIIGVVADVRNVPLAQPVEPAIYFSARQFPFRAMFLTVRGTSRDAAVAAIRTSLHELLPTVPAGNIETWGDHIRARTAEPRLLGTILVFFGGLAGLLAAIGVYGLFAWSVALRRRELAIRLTLGARPGGIGALVMRQSLLLVAIGLAAGWLLVTLAHTALARVLFEVEPNDAGSTAVACGLLLVVSLAASLPAAVRAMHVDPVAGLRVE